MPENITTINFRINKIIKYSLVLLLIGICFFTYLNFKVYNISELSHSIIITELKKETSKNIFDYHNTDYLTLLENNKYNQSCFCNGTLFRTKADFLTLAYEELKNKEEKADCCYFNIKWVTEGKQHLELSDQERNIYFQIFYENGITYKYALMSEIEFNDDNSLKQNITIKNCVDFLLNSHELILLKTNEEDHYDYLIKDLGDSFLIYTIVNHINKPNAIWFSLYKKQKKIQGLFDL